MVLVDSSVWIEAARRDGAMDVKCSLEGLLEEFEAAVCGLVLLEVVGGARPSERSRMIGYFSALPRLRIGEDTWDRAVDAGSVLRDRGFTIPLSDVLVATIALVHNVRVYACDRHFDHMAPLMGLQLYEPGYGGRFVR